MRRSSFTERFALAAAGACALLVTAQPAGAVPLFAQRYHLQCGACHSVLPELNAFGNAFRDRGYRIDGLPRHGTTIVGLREQVGYDRDPGPGARRVSPAGALLGAAEVGRVEAFVHESLGSGGGPSSLFLGYLAAFSPRSGILYRLGLVELPLVHSPAQRNDTLETYGYEGSRVGLNDLTLATPRWALEAERSFGPARLAATVAFANATGSAYGGAPVSTGTSGQFAAPEIGLFARYALTPDLSAGVDLLAGSRAIAVSGRPGFNDTYHRGGAWVGAKRGRVELLAEQWVGEDANPDGASSRIVSRGGWARLRYALGAHAFVGIREDAAATPAQTRALLWYAQAQAGRHTRLLVEQQRAIPGGATSLRGALTIGVPWPWGR